MDKGSEWDYVARPHQLKETLELATLKKQNLPVNPFTCFTYIHAF